jgi:hypothetical protein
MSELESLIYCLKGTPIQILLYIPANMNAVLDTLGLELDNPVKTFFQNFFILVKQPG